MMCYMDRTFCPGWICDRCADSEGCDRVLDDEVQAGAVEWWGSDEAPICIFAEEPTCFVDKEET